MIRKSIPARIRRTPCQQAFFHHKHPPFLPFSCHSKDNGMKFVGNTKAIINFAEGNNGDYGK
jgi:hypothetical protein